MALEPKQAAFVREYLVDMNAAQAAIRAGYAKGSAKVTGCRLLTHDNVKAAIREALQQTVEKVVVTKEWLVQQTIETYQAGRALKQVAAARGCLELLGKLNGHIIERKDIRRVNNWSDLTDEELEKLATSPDAPTATGVRH